MFIDISREKLFMIFVMIVAIAGLIVVFTLANDVWSILPQTSYEITRAESQFIYWLEYELPGYRVAVAGAVPQGDARSIPVLLYHGEGGSSANMQLSVFVDQLRALKENGWQTITMEQYDEWEKGEIQLPDKSFLLTFDDGRKDTYYEADPVLQEMGFHAIMFVITGFSMPADGKDSNFYLNKTELANMVASGRWEMESHGDLDHALYAVQSTTNLSQAATTTQGHFLSNKFWDPQTNAFETNAQFTARVQGDMKNSVQTLEQDFGINVIAFAYPFNDYGEDSVNFPGSQAILDTVMPQIYTYTFYQTWPQNGDTFNYPLTNNGPGTRPYMEKRFEPGLDWTGQELIDVLNAGAAKPLPYRSSSFGQEWVQAWGNATSTSSGLVLSADPTTSGADSFLNGSGWWGNYYFSAVVDWRRGSDISLFARNAEDETYVACAFSSTYVEIERHTGEAQTNLASTDQEFSGPGATVHVGIGVVGDTVTCYENDVAVLSATSASIPSKGGIGVEVWDKNLDVAASVVKSVSVSQQAPVASVATSVSTVQAPAIQPSVPTSAPTTPTPAIIAPARPAPPATTTSTDGATSTSNLLTDLLRKFRLSHRASGSPNN
ncbi:MAG TPA: polysaccharide deacetylase family protein [Candidatus Paceibacterota bacterium]|nr:polysaccharide deacetylase family protein [Candidatus Paceibacterota bacterium]